MSTIIALKDHTGVVLGTDSRFMAPDFSRIASDAVQKIHEIAPQTFLATSGRTMVCDFQRDTAQQLAERLDTTDVRAISEALDRETIAYLSEWGEFLLSLPQSPQITRGDKPLHGCVLVGRTADGKLGYISHLYHQRDGAVVNEGGEYFGAPRNIFISGGEPIAHLGQDSATWTDGPVKVVRRFLAELKKRDPHIGGPDQVVMLDRSGAHWICRPPEAASLAADMATTHATISAAITMTAPTIISTVGSDVASLANGLIESISANYRAKIQSGQLTLSAIAAGQPLAQHQNAYSGWLDGYGFTVVSCSSSTGVRVNGPAGANRISLTADAANFTSCPIRINGVDAINTSGQFVGAGVNCPSYGVAAAGFNPNVGGVQYYGRSGTFYDRDGNQMIFRNGVLTTA